MVSDLSLDPIVYGSAPVLPRHCAEIKGPGAKGAMPVLRPGERWAYSSGIQIMTIRGSMHGWFIFEEVMRAFLCEGCDRATLSSALRGSLY